MLCKNKYASYLWVEDVVSTKYNCIWPQVQAIWEDGRRAVCLYSTCLSEHADVSGGRTVRAPSPALPASLILVSRRSGNVWAGRKKKAACVRLATRDRESRREASGGGGVLLHARRLSAYCSWSILTVHTDSWVMLVRRDAKPPGSSSTLVGSWSLARRGVCPCIASQLSIHCALPWLFLLVWQPRQTKNEHWI